jgi:hypothetical protein
MLVAASGHVRRNELFLLVFSFAFYASPLATRADGEVRCRRQHQLNVTILEPAYSHRPPLALNSVAAGSVPGGATENFILSNFGTDSEIRTKIGAETA